MPTIRRTTASTFGELKAAGRKISMLTAYDFPTAKLLDEAGVDGVLVGDTVAMVVQGHETTLPATLDQMIYHAEIVGRAVERALVVVDLPFPVANLGPRTAVESAARILKETRCQAVKLEGGEEQSDVIAALVAAGVPVMAHCGLRPQAVHVLGGYKVQREEERLLADAMSVQAAGAFSIVLECIPEPIAARISKQLTIPTIGIGAGNGCDGQVLVTNDLLGLTSGYVPKFVKAYADLRTTISDAVRRYCAEVQTGAFPDAPRTYK